VGGFLAFAAMCCSREFPPEWDEEGERPGLEREGPDRRREGRAGDRVGMEAGRDDRRTPSEITAQDGRTFFCGSFTGSSERPESCWRSGGDLLFLLSIFPGSSGLFSYTGSSPIPPALPVISTHWPIVAPAAALDGS